MDELIKVNYDNERPTASARDLWEFLEVKTAFKDWFPRMCEYGFTETIDFNPLKFEQVQNEGHREVKRIVTDYQLTVPMAKEISMIQRNDKGKEARQYFIKIEEAWNNPEMVMARALKLADTKIKRLEFQIEEQKPLVEFAAHVTDSADAIDIGELAKLANKENIKIGRNRLFEYLRDNKILMQNNEPYQRYIENKWFKTIETTKQTSYGTKLFVKTLVLGKGQVGIIEMLRKEFGIVNE